jgi:hypothetical protein
MRVCMSTYLNMCTRAHVCVRMCTCVHVCVRMCTRVCTYVHICALCAYVHKCSDVCDVHKCTTRVGMRLSVHTSVEMCVMPLMPLQRLYVPMYCMYASVYVCVYVHLCE